MYTKTLKERNVLIFHFWMFRTSCSLVNLMALSRVAVFIFHFDLYLNYKVWTTENPERVKTQKLKATLEELMWLLYAALHDRNTRNKIYFTNYTTNRFLVEIIQ